MKRLFGTDGVRGIANEELSPELAFELGKAGAYILTEEGRRSKILIGRDTRISGDMLESALVAGICSLGVDVLLVGIISTPAIAYLTKELGADAGIVISASHNPVEDNGIKFFGRDGYKLSDEKEMAIERLIYNPLDYPHPVGGKIGRVYQVENGEDLYIAHAKNTIKCDLQGLKIVVDGANGAASYLAPQIFKELGAQVIAINCHPDGVNINLDCGSTHPQKLQQAVLDHKADLGLAHDGDADRVIAVDENGNLVDGDHIMTICCLHLWEKEQLKNQTLVVTVMTNLGLRLALAKTEVKIVETKVGDRYVLEGMKEHDAILGGEQSGHIIFLEHNTTGDGIITALQLLAVVKEKGKTLGQLASQMKRLPQLLVNVRVKDKNKVMEIQEVQEAIREAEERLEGRGRVLIRPSGTEPLVRVMVEGEKEEELEEIANGVARVIESQA